MKFKVSVIISVIFHISLFAIAIYFPRTEFNKGTTYYVDLVNFYGGTPGGGNANNSSQTNLKDAGAKLASPKTGRVKDLTTQKSETAKLRYPDKSIKKKKNNRKTGKTKPKPKEEIITVVQKKRNRPSSEPDSISVNAKEDNILKTGISSGSGSGSGRGMGSGSGSGLGGSGKSSPYAYYYDRLIRRISTSWYNSLVSPGLRGKFITTVYFRIYRNGQIRDTKVETKSGVESLDLSALRAVSNAAPFAPLPSDYPYQYIIVHFDFTWEK